jgi:SAM-dependent methyltransferase
MKDTFFPVASIGSREAYGEYVQSRKSEYAKRQEYERSLLEGHRSCVVTGYCYPCRREVPFSFDYLLSCTIQGILTPNWRERLICPICGLNNRMRACIHLFEMLLKTDREHSAIYITERVTPVYEWLARHYVNVTGTEYFGGSIPSGIHSNGIRNENLTKLSFFDGTFDVVLSFDVFEHIPDFHAAFRECHRVLKPGGKLFFTVPFDTNREENLVRAIMKARDEIQHLLPPEIHGNPVNPDHGSLSFYVFGWEMLDQLREAGFNDVSAHLYWSKNFGYLGTEQYVFIATRR